MTYADDQMLEKMKVCDCGSDFPAMYVCLKAENECPNTQQKVYCMTCYENDKHPHPHEKPARVAREIRKCRDMWLNLKININNLSQRAIPAFQKYEHLIKYLQNAVMESDAQISQPVSWLSDDFETLEIIHAEISKIYDDKVSHYNTEAMIEEMLLLNN